MVIYNGYIILIFSDTNVELEERLTIIKKHNPNAKLSTSINNAIECYIQNYPDTSIITQCKSLKWSFHFDTMFDGGDDQTKGDVENGVCIRLHTNLGLVQEDNVECTQCGEMVFVESQVVAPCPNCSSLYSPCTYCIHAKEYYDIETDTPAVCDKSPCGFVGKPIT